MPDMSTKLEFESPEGRLSLSIDDVEFMAYGAGELAMRSMRELVERMRRMGLGAIAEAHARVQAQSKVTIMELREMREDAEAILLLGSQGETIDDTITPRLDALRQTIAQTQVDMRASVDRLAALAVSCHEALMRIPGYRPPSEPRG